MLCGLCCAAALAQLVGGVVFEDQEGKLLSVDDALKLARTEFDRVAAQAKPAIATTDPASLKRLLKPLLVIRPDLTLIGRRLVIRPVRHLLRGALIDRMSDKRQIRLWWFVKPLCQGPGIGHGNYFYDGAWRIDEPHFSEFLFDTLRSEIFMRAKQVCTLDDFIAELESLRLAKPMIGANIMTKIDALLMNGNIDHATMLLETFNSPHETHVNWKADRLAAISRGPDEVYSLFRALEAEGVKSQKLQKIWEPTPFPGELRDREHGRADLPSLHSKLLHGSVARNYLQNSASMKSAAFVMPKQRVWRKHHGSTYVSHCQLTEIGS